MTSIDWTYVHSYEEALEALNNGAQNISTYGYNNSTALVKYKENMDSFSRFARTIAGNESLSCLSLDMNFVIGPGVTYVADALKINTSLTELNLSNNWFGDEGAKEIADALKVNTGLTSLNLWNNLIHTGARNIAEALKENNTLTELKLQFNQIGRYAAEDIADALKINTSLTTLLLQYNLFGPSGAKNIANGLKENDTLTSLDFYANFIGPEGAKEVADALKINTSLTKLNLWNNQIRPYGAKEIADALKENNTLMQLDLSLNDIGQKGARKIANALKVNKSLALLYLGSNGLGDKSTISLVSAVVQNDQSALECLDLSTSSVSKNGKKKIQEELKKLSKLRLKPLEIKLDTSIVKRKALSDQQRKELARGVANKKTRWGQCKVMVVGEGRAGKTQTIRSLVGDTFEDRSMSTWAGEIGLVQTLVSGGFTRMGESEDVEIQSLFNDLAREEKISTKRTFGLPFTAKKRENEAQKHAEKMLESKTATTRIIKYPESPVKIIDETESEIVSGANQRLVFTIWDFGGQNVFKVIHHLFLSDDGVYLLVFDMTKLLSEETREESERTLLFWLRSIEMHSKEAPVLIVGTHLDECENDRETDVLNINDILDALIPNRMKSSICKYEKLSFFPIDNQRVDGSNLSVFDKLRSTIVAEANSLESVTRDDIPMRWLLYLDSIRERKNVTPTINLNDLLDDLKEFSIEGDEANRMLQFFHRMGTFLYWDTAESLKNTVILKPQWLIDASARIVHNKGFHQVYLEEGLLKRLRNQEMYNEMHTTGKIQLELLECVLWASEEFSHRIAYLIELFKRMFIMSEIDMNTYIVPALLRSLSQSATESTMNEVKEAWKESVDLHEGKLLRLDSKIYFTWLPPGLFERLACVCVQRYSDEISQTVISSSAIMYHVDTDLRGLIPVLLNYNESQSSITISTLAGSKSALSIAQNVLLAITLVLQKSLGLVLEFSVFLVGNNSNEFELQKMIGLGSKQVVYNSKKKKKKVKELGLWLSELHSGSEMLNGPNSLSFRVLNTTKELLLEDFEAKVNFWVKKWEGLQRESETLTELLGGGFDEKSTQEKKEIIFKCFNFLLEGPMELVARMWGDALENAKNTGGNLTDYKNVVAPLLVKLGVDMTVDSWVKIILEHVQVILTREHRYGIFFSHQGVKQNPLGKNTTTKIIMDTMKVLYTKEIRTQDNKEVKVFFDRSSIVPGSHQFNAMLLTVCATDKVMVFIDQDYFSKKWCLLEYFLAKGRDDIIMPFLIDSPVLPFELPERMSRKRMDANFRHDDIIKYFQGYFAEKQSNDYTTGV